MFAAEVIAFADLLNDAFTLRAQLEQALNRSKPLHLLIDSKSLFYIIGKNSRTSEKRLMLDTSTTREAYNSEQVSNIGFVRSSYNLADGLTKPRIQQALYDLITPVRHTIHAEQWIMRNAQ